MTPDPEHVQSRANLLPEERSAGPSVDEAAQAFAILEESDERLEAPHDPPDGESDPRSDHYQEHEHRRSADTV